MNSKIPCSLMVNGDPFQVMVEAGETLLFTLREQLHLTGTKEGCSMGECGSCTVLMNGKPVMSCLVLSLEAQQADIQTIEGVANGEHLHPLQEQFVKQGAVQCGFCTPGMIMSAKGLLDRGAEISGEDIQRALSGNHCRCTGYTKIVRAVTEARKQLDHES